MAKGIPDYDELRIRIEPLPGGDFHVAAFGPSGDSAGGHFVLPFNEHELDLFVLQVGIRKRRMRSVGSSHMDEVKSLGSALFGALIKDDIEHLYLDACRAADLHDRGLRVTLHLTGAPHLMNVPWEYLYEEPRFLAQSIYTPVVRSLDLRTVRAPRRLEPPLRVLGMVSRPSRHDDLDAEQEQANLAAALEPLRAAGLVDVQWLNRATLAELHRVISAPDEFHVLHCIGHGAYDDTAEQGYLIFETDQGWPRPVSGEEIGALLQDERSLRLVVLNSCEGARTSHADPFSGVASGILGYGVPAVIGMQFEITDDAAVTFSDQLYSSLVQGFTVDASVAQARKAIYAGGHDVEFGTPVLYLRGHETRLFDVDDLTVRCSGSFPVLEVPDPGQGVPLAPVVDPHVSVDPLHADDVAEPMLGVGVVVDPRVVAGVRRSGRHGSAQRRRRHRDDRGALHQSFQGSSWESGGRSGLGAVRPP